MSEYALGTAAGADARPVGDFPWLSYLAWTITLASLIPWRAATYYAGGLDVVVLGKAALLVAAAVLAWPHTSRDVHRTIGARSFVLVLGYIAISLVGAVARGQVMASAVLAARVGLVAIVVAMLVVRSDDRQLIVSLRAALLTAGLALGVLGIPSFLISRRLGIGIPPHAIVSPNLVGLIYGVALLLVLWSVFTGVAPVRGGNLLALGLFTAVWLTGSRTALAATLASVVLMIVLVRRLPRSSIVILILSAPVAYYVLFMTAAFSSFVARGGAASVVTLNSRTIAWKAVLSVPYEFWQSMFGRGLSAKTVGVSGTYWDFQVVDSSWVSAVVQAGWLGFVMLLIWVTSVVVTLTRVPARLRQVLLPVTVCLLVSSLTASGLIDAFVLFALMFTVSLMSEPVAWRGSRPAVPRATARSEVMAS